MLILCFTFTTTQLTVSAGPRSGGGQSHAQSVVRAFDELTKAARQTNKNAALACKLNIHLISIFSSSIQSLDTPLTFFRTDISNHSTNKKWLCYMNIAKSSTKINLLLLLLWIRLTFSQLKFQDWTASIYSVSHFTILFAFDCV